MDRTHGSKLHRQNGQVVFYRNEVNGETRHCFISIDVDVIRFHESFTPEDNEQGWKMVLGRLAAEMSDAEIENQHNCYPVLQTS